MESAPCNLTCCMVEKTFAAFDKPGENQSAFLLFSSIVKRKRKRQKDP
jgi:hypothetical protein